jgi:hypothetical protein
VSAISGLPLEETGPTELAPAAGKRPYPLLPMGIIAIVFPLRYYFNTALGYIGSPLKRLKYKAVNFVINIFA